MSPYLQKAINNIPQRIDLDANEIEFDGYEKDEKDELKQLETHYEDFELLGKSKPDKNEIIADTLEDYEGNEENIIKLLIPLENSLNINFTNILKNIQNNYVKDII